MSTHPRHVEVLLSSLGARSEFRDALIGDLAEDFARRAERDGARAARRWYYRQAVRAIPHLVRSWWETARAADFRRILGVAATSYVMVLMLSIVLMASAVSIASAMGLSREVQHAMWGNHGDPGISALMLANLLVLNSLATVLGGYIAAWLDARTPMISAATLAFAGLVWAFVALAITMIGRGGPTMPVPLSVRLVSTTILIVGPIAGGVLRIARSGISSEDEPDDLRVRPSRLG